MGFSHTCHKQIEGQVHVKRHAIFLFIKNKVASPLKGEKEKCSITKEEEGLDYFFMSQILITMCRESKSE
jgi:hypothetical protein